MLHAPAQSPPSLAPEDGPPPQRHPKRKASTQDNERLSKRLSLLNIEQDGRKVYVPVESPSESPSSSSRQAAVAPSADDVMQMDESKHKVYIYNLDDELSEDDSDVEKGKLVFLPDIEKHLKLNRIPRHILEKPAAEEEDMQVVLYSDPKSLSVPENSDGVRKAIIEARRRTREKQRLAREGLPDSTENAVADPPRVDNDEEMQLD
ncbi:hypothetical protein LIA77_00911 [Sarocladium implicatum]|nr:hypothetical protein LIA77_00911 [Sarocladium implicatum]